MRRLGPQDAKSARAAHAELEADGFPFLLVYSPGEPWTDYVARLIDHEHGLNLPEGFVPHTFMVGVVDGTIVGRCSIRHKLNEALLERGGNIGYAVRPEFRRRGYASEMFRQALSISRGIGLERALVTTDGANEPSWRIIERNGGVLEPTGSGTEDSVRRYWVALNPSKRVLAEGQQAT